MYISCIQVRRCGELIRIFPSPLSLKYLKLVEDQLVSCTLNFTYIIIRLSNVCADGHAGVLPSCLLYTHVLMLHVAVILATLFCALQRYYNLLLNAWIRRYHKQHSRGQ